MTAWLPRLLFGIHIMLLTVAAYVVADVVNLGIARRLEASVGPQGVMTTSLTNSVTARADRAAYERILRGDLFHPDLRGRKDSRIDVPTPEPVVPLALPLVLIGTGVGEGAGSFAIIADTRSQEQQVYRLHELVRDGAQLVKVERNEAVLRRGTQEQTLLAFADGTQDIEPPTPRTWSRPTQVTAPTDGIQQVQPNQWVLDKNEVDAALENLPQLLTKARVIPNFVDGQPDGFKIFSIAPDSLYAKIGLQNGDVLQQINGVALRDPENFMRVFQQLKDETHIALDFTRNDQRESYSYEIR